MALQRAEGILRRRLAQHGLGTLASAGALCRQSELLCPNCFKAISLRSGVLHLELDQKHLLSFKQVEGKLLTQLNIYSESHALPRVSRFRLTISE